MGFESFWDSGVGIRCTSRPADRGRVFLELVWPPLSVLEMSPSNAVGEVHGAAHARSF